MTKSEFGTSPDSQDGARFRRRITGILITYTWRPEGNLFPIREGKNFIGAGMTGNYVCDIYIPDDTKLSSEHAVIECHNGIYGLVDLESSNGTFLNGKLVPPRGVELPNYSEIQTGSTIWMFITVSPTIASILTSVESMKFHGQVFVSYAHEDRSKTQILANVLEQNGFVVWWDRGVLPGQFFENVIQDALNAASCVIVLWSKASVLSPWVRDEANEGVKRGILIPVLVEDIPIPLGFRSIQAARLLDWPPRSDDTELDYLVQAVKQKLQPE